MKPLVKIITLVQYPVSNLMNSKIRRRTLTSSRNKSARKEGKARSPISLHPLLQFPPSANKAANPPLQFNIPFRLSIPLSIHPLSIPDYRSFCVMHNSSNPPFRTQHCPISRAVSTTTKRFASRRRAKHTQQRRLYIEASRRLRGFRNDQLAGGASTRGKGETERERMR